MNKINKMNKQRLATLRKIEHAIAMWRHGYGNAVAFPTVFFFSILGGLIAYVCQSIWMMGNLVTLAGALSGGIFGYWRAKHKTTTALVYYLLASYQPINADAYQHIQKIAAEKNLSFDLVLEWMQSEKDAIALPQGKTKLSEIDLARERFVKRELNS